MDGSIEVMLDLSSSLRDVKAHVRPLFTQEQIAGSESLFFHGLLGLKRRKGGWTGAAAAGAPDRWREQAMLCGGW